MRKFVILVQSKAFKKVTISYLNDLSTEHWSVVVLQKNKGEKGFFHEDKKKKDILDLEKINSHPWSFSLWDEHIFCCCRVVFW